MSEVTAEGGASTEEATVDQAQTETAVETQASAGWLLRQAREAAGVDLASLAVALKVSVKKLEALESDRLDLLPDAVFVRALAASVCRALKIDAAPVLARLPHTVAPRLNHDEAGLNTPFHMPGDVAKAPFWDRLSRPMVLAALAVLLGALVLIFFPSSEQRAEIGAIVSRPPAAAAPAVAVAPVAAAPQAPAVLPAVAAAPTSPHTLKPAPVSGPVNAPVVAKTPSPAPAPSVVARPAPPPATAPAAAAPVASPVAASAAADGEAPVVRKKLSSSGVVVFKTTGPSWIEVTDAKGAVQLSRMVEPGDTVGASGPLPLTVTIGRADVTEVTVRGKPFPLEGVTRQGVARFEVK